MTNISPKIEARRDRAKEWFESLQTRIFAELERLEAEALAALEPPLPEDGLFGGGAMITEPELEAEAELLADSEPATPAEDHPA